MKKLTYMVIAAICALSIAGLAGCGGGASSSAAASGSASASAASASASASSSAALSDEDQIKADFKSIIDQAMAPEVIAASLGENEGMAALSQLTGMSIDEFAELVCQAIKIEAKDVKVDGDTAVLTVTMSVPDFEAGDDVMNKKLEEMTADFDPTTASEEDIAKVFGDMMRAIMTDPDMPQHVDEMTIDYKKTNGVWAIADPDALNESISTITDSM